MFPLFSAIQRKAWMRASKLSYELLLCDPERASYQDLYQRLQQLTALTTRRKKHLHSSASQARTPSVDREKSDQQSS